MNRELANILDKPVSEVTQEDMGKLSEALKQANYDLWDLAREIEATKNRGDNE